MQTACAPFMISNAFHLYCTNIWMVSCELEQHSTSNYVQLASQSIQHLIYISTRMNLLFNNMQSLVRAVQLHVFMGLLSSVLCCPLRFSFKSDVRFVLFTSFCKGTRFTYAICIYLRMLGSNTIFISHVRVV